LHLVLFCALAIAFICAVEMLIPNLFPVTDKFSVLW